MRIPFAFSLGASSPALLCAPLEVRACRQRCTSARSTGGSVFAERLAAWVLDGTLGTVAFPMGRLCPRVPGPSPWLAGGRSRASSVRAAGSAPSSRPRPIVQGLPGPATTSHQPLFLACVCSACTERGRICFLRKPAVSEHAASRTASTPRPSSRDVTIKANATPNKLILRNRTPCSAPAQTEWLFFGFCLPRRAISRCREIYS